MHQFGWRNGDTDHQHDGLPEFFPQLGLDTPREVLVATASDYSELPSMHLDVPSVWTFCQDRQAAGVSSNFSSHPPFTLHEGGLRLSEMASDCVDPKRISQTHQFSPQPASSPWSHTQPLTQSRMREHIESIDHVLPHTPLEDLSMCVPLSPQAQSSAIISQAQQITSSNHCPPNLHYNYGHNQMDRKTWAHLDQRPSNDLTSATTAFANAYDNRQDSWAPTIACTSAIDGLHDSFKLRPNQVQTLDVPNSRRTSGHDMLGNSVWGYDHTRDFATNQQRGSAQHASEPTGFGDMFSTSADSWHSSFTRNNSRPQEVQHAVDVPSFTDAPALVPVSVETSSSSSSKRSQKLPKKIYQCKQCIMNFPRPSALVVHERIHSGHRPFTCDECSRTFTVSSNLRRHQKIHARKRSIDAHLVQHEMMLDTTTIRPTIISAKTDALIPSSPSGSECWAPSITGSDISYPSTRSTASTNMLGSRGSIETTWPLSDEDGMQFKASSQYITKWAEEMVAEEHGHRGAHA